MTRLAVIAATALVFASCAPPPKPPRPEPDTGAQPAEARERQAYEGVLPCADCAGIHTLLVLDPVTSRYQLVETYQGTGQPDSVFSTRGEWATVHGSASDSGAFVYQLDSRRAPSVRSFVRVNENEIRQLDHEQRDIDSRLPYSLSRVSLPESMAVRRTITLADSGRAVRLRRGEELTVRLPSDRSTGYGWVWIDTVAVPLVRVAGPQFEPAGADQPGAAGHESFTFRGKGSGTGTLRLAYRRPGEPGAAPTRKFRVRIKPG